MTTKTATRARYTLESKQEAVRLVEGGQSIAAAARALGVVDQTRFNWVKSYRQGKLSLWTPAGKHLRSSPPGHGMRTMQQPPSTRLWHSC